jgi:hypothetical protein
MGLHMSLQNKKLKKEKWQANNDYDTASSQWLQKIKCRQF